MQRVVWWAPLAVMLGCSGSKPPPLSIKIAHAAAGGLCFGPGSRPSDDALTTLPVALVRLSIRRHAPGEVGGSFACDRVMQVPGDQPTLQVFASQGETFDFYGEAFSKAADSDPDNGRVGPYRRVASGTLLGVDPTAGSLATLRLYPVSEFRCVDARLAQARAFHSATALPNGQVLIFGGLVASPTDGAHELIDSDTFWVTSSAELYDPSTGSFVQLAQPGLLPRAFHTATLVNNTPPYQILLTGGITTSDPTGMQPQLARNNGAKGDAARLAPEIPGLIPTELPTRAAGTELIVFDTTQKTIARANSTPAIPGAAFQGAAPVPNGVALAGGIDYGVGATSDLSQANKIYVSNGNAVRVAQLSAARVGATLSKLFGDTALVWGGELSTVDSMMKPVPIGDVVSGLTSAAPAVTPVNPPMLPPTLFHSATAFASLGGSASVLVSGGFELQSGRVAIQPPRATQGLYIHNVTGTVVTPGAVTLKDYLADATCMAADRYRPAGYQNAVLLNDRDGEVLVTGGAPRFDACNDCEDSSQPSPFCSLHQASRFVPPATLARIAPMQVGRWGHATAQLPDGNVLITGGVELPAGAMTARLVGDAEVFNPRDPLPRFDLATGANDRDDPLHDELTNLDLIRAPGDVARDPNNGGMQARACPDL